MDLSIITVAYKCKTDIDTTLTAVFDSDTSVDFEYILLDNDSQDGTVEMVREKFLSDPAIASKLQLIETGGNLGFGKGNNIGLKKAKGDYILLLNSDTKVDPDNLEVMVNFMKSRPDVGAATCKLVMRNGQIDRASRRSEPNLVRSFFRMFGFQALFPKLFGGYNMLDSDPEIEGEIEACSGAYMIISRKCYEAVGGFDERFFMYAEDLDLCRRIREANFKIWWYPKTTCVHYRGQSSKKTPQKMLKAFHNANWLYYKKWYSAKYWHLLDPFVYSANQGLFLWKSMLNHFRKEKYVSKQ
jgi:GT2 family glycosyltransferase